MAIMYLYVRVCIIDKNKQPIITIIIPKKHISRFHRVYLIKKSRNKCLRNLIIQYYSNMILFLNTIAHIVPINYCLCNSEMYNWTSFIHQSTNYWQHYIVECHVLVSSESNMYQIIQSKLFKLDRTYYSIHIFSS